MGGSILFTLGIMGRYLARIFDDVKGRPLYVVADTRGIPAE
jgi:dolichol-phosphate mannosyltransferase